MAPKNLPPAAKQAMILSWFHRSGTAHSIKDLEKVLPQVASINSMQTKDYLQALSDEGKIRVEKIGSGNWYWSFPSEERQNKQAILDKAVHERDRTLASVADLKGGIEAAGAAREEDDGGPDAYDRTRLSKAQAELQTELEQLRAEMLSYSEDDPTEIHRKKEETEEYMANAERWTDNIYILEAYYRELDPGNQEGLDNLRRELYGDDYQEGEGLKDL
ncbi:MAG: hypothetical protein M1819_006301 [Sarea resinae]|nr:MAG: hypothetical protein M1819_006301 [Sarea resinae]